MDITTLNRWDYQAFFVFLGLRRSVVAAAASILVNDAVPTTPLATTTPIKTRNGLFVFVSLALVLLLFIVDAAPMGMFGLDVGPILLKCCVGLESDRAVTRWTTGTIRLMV